VLTNQINHFELSQKEFCLSFSLILGQKGELKFLLNYKAEKLMLAN
jgi:hypothetical protein